ncbi:unnamed protein product [Rotaria socialis]|uniref:Uncharacterized protein n=1 Tax=Rotaria socialis TaxID=392032 RepID=A0A818C7N3_9BILA|nr:unnamed protein product [Rotaria socialis]CAF3427370.1 unnamed protein product [Rotaria socialis]
MLLSKKCFYIDSLRISDPIFDSFYFLFNNQGDSNGARWSSWKPLIYIVRVIFQSIVVKQCYLCTSVDFLIRTNSDVPIM